MIHDRVQMFKAVVWKSEGRKQLNEFRVLQQGRGFGFTGYRKKSLIKFWSRYTWKWMFVLCGFLDSSVACSGTAMWSAVSSKLFCDLSTWDEPFWRRFSCWFEVFSCFLKTILFIKEKCHFIKIESCFMVILNVLHQFQCVMKSVSQCECL